MSHRNGDSYRRATFLLPQIMDRANFSSSVVKFVYDALLTIQAYSAVGPGVGQLLSCLCEGLALAGFRTTRCRFGDRQRFKTRWRFHNAWRPGLHQV